MKTEITPLVKLLFCNCLDLKALVVTEFKAIISFYFDLNFTVMTGTLSFVVYKNTSIAQS
jgi:hypothetical protein